MLPSGRDRVKGTRILAAVVHLANFASTFAAFAVKSF